MPDDGHRDVSHPMPAAWTITAISQGIRFGPSFSPANSGAHGEGSPWRLA